MSGFVEIRRTHIQRAKYYASFVLGLLLSIWMLPHEALDIPTYYSDTAKSAQVAFYPMHRSLFLFLIMVPVGYVIGVYVTNYFFESAYENEGN